MPLNKNSVYGVIYRITNKENGMVYIGRTINYESRIKNHLADATVEEYRTRPLYAFISRNKELGTMENVVFDIICYCFDYNSLCNAEFAIMKSYNSLGYGLYNLSGLRDKRRAFKSRSRRFKKTTEIISTQEFIKQQMEMRGLSQKGLADKLNTTQPTISRLLTGKYKISGEMRVDIAKNFDYSFECVFREID